MTLLGKRQQMHPYSKVTSALAKRFINTGEKPQVNMIASPED